jgi:integrase
MPRAHLLLGHTFRKTSRWREQARRIPISPSIDAVLAAQTRIYAWVFVNARTGRPLTSNGVAHVFNRAVARAGVATGDVTLHTLRHTALSRMIATAYDDDPVMSISGHSSTRMLACDTPDRRAEDRGTQPRSRGHK